MKIGLSGRIAQAFIDSKLTPLLMLVFLAIGAYATYLTPSEEEPQISVPIADVFVRYPGANPTEVENRVAKPLEKIAANIPGVEYVYSTSMPEMAMLIIRYKVGEDTDRSLFKLYNEISKNMDKMPAGVSLPLIKSKAIDDVPMLALTLWSDKYDDFALRRVAAELSTEIKQITDVAETRLIGGRDRQIRVILNPQKMAGYMIDPLMLAQQIPGLNQQGHAGLFNTGDVEYSVEVGNFLQSAADVENLVVGVYQNSPVYLKQFATIVDGPEEAQRYVAFGFGAAANQPAGEYPAVTIAVSKRKGADATRIAAHIEEKVETLKGRLIPAEIQATIVRNYGESASEKVHELLRHLFWAIVSVTIFVTLAMGWRGGLVVFASVPVTFALTLFVYYMYGYTLNRITLFALVFVTGIVVDDSIIIAENMHRHFKMKRLPFLQAAITAIDEVGNPTILATFTVIASVLPMAFVSGLMGPYMSPMPIGAAMAMLFSLIVALTMTPWLAYRLLRSEADHSHGEAYALEKTRIYRLYRAAIEPMIESAAKRWTFIGVIVVLLLGSLLLFYFKLVAVKMLPFDNKNEIQVIIDMPEGATLERTAAVTQEIAAYLRTQPEVVNYQTYVGTAAPINFNGLVRHYDLRRGSNVADIQLNLTAKNERSEQSHAIAKRIRATAQAIGNKHQANVKIAEVPPGPPVLSTLVAEIYGPDYAAQIAAAEKVKAIFQQTPGVVDVDWYVEAEQPEYKFEIDREKAALSGVSPQQIVNALGLGLHGLSSTTLYQPNDAEPVPVLLRLGEAERSDLTALKSLRVMSRSGHLVAIGDLTRLTPQTQDHNIYRKNQQRVVYITADVAGELESPVYAIMDIDRRIAEKVRAGELSLKTYYAGQPFTQEELAMKWDGEWQITYEVFRDLGIAFVVVLIVIYMLIIGWFQSFKTPLVMMVAIPLSLVGILVSHLIFDAFFTATSMIGMIALAGIMVRNSVLLIDFINLRLEENIPLKQAVIEAGAVRTTPILLTAGTVVIGAFVILFDPIFQGLALSLMGGSIASTGLTLLIVPLIFYMTERKNYPVPPDSAPKTV